MQGIGLSFSEESIRKLRQQFDNLIKELNSKGQVNINVDGVNQEIAKIKNQLNDLLGKKPIDLTVNTAQVEADLKKTVSTIDEAIRHYEQLGKVSPPKRIYDESGNLKEFVIELERVDGLIEKINYKASTFQDMGNGRLKPIAFDSSSVVEIDKTAEATERLIKKQERFQEEVYKSSDSLEAFTSKMQSKLNKLFEDDILPKDKLIEFEQQLNSLDLSSSKTDYEKIRQQMSGLVELQKEMVQQKKEEQKAISELFEANEKEQLRIAKLGELMRSVDSGVFAKSDDEIKQYIQSISEADAKIVNFKREVDSAGNSLIKMTVNTKNNKNEIQQEKIVLDQTTQALYRQESAIKANTARMVSFRDRLRNAWVAVTSFATVTTTFYTLVRQIKDGVNTIIELDEAMVGLRKVTDETDETYRKFIDTANDMAISVGHSTKSAIEATTYFAKLGYSLEEAGRLAEKALVFSNIGDMSIDDASENLIAIMKGFKLSVEDVTRIMDVANEVGNKYSITTDGIAEALKRSSASLSLANNSLEESVGLIVSANNAIQDPEKVGNALKTMSMRLRGIKDDTGELIPKLRETVKAVSGVDIMLNENTFKSTYQIMKEISQVYDTLSDKNKAYLAELIAGKQQGNVFASIMQNMQEGTQAYETALNSMGSSTKEQERYMESINAKINTLKESMVKFWKDSIDSSTVKGVIDVLTSLIKTFNNLNKILPIAIGLFTLFNRKAIADFIVNVPQMAIGLKNAVTSLFAFKTALEGTSLAMSNFQRALGIIGIALSVVTIAYSVYTQKQEEARQRSEQLQQQLQQEASEIQNLKDEYIDIIKSGDLTNESKQRLKSIQEQLIQSYGLEANALDLVNGKYEEQVKLLNQASVEKAKEAIKAMGSAPDEARDALDKKFRIPVTVTYYTMSDAEKTEGFSDIINQLNIIKIRESGKIIIESTGTIEDTAKQIGEVIEQLQNLPNKTEGAKQVLSKLTEQYNNLTDEAKGYHDTLNKYNEAKNYVDFYEGFANELSKVDSLMRQLRETSNEDTNKRSGITKQINEIKESIMATAEAQGKLESYKSWIDKTFSSIENDTSAIKENTDAREDNVISLEEQSNALKELQDAFDDSVSKGQQLNDLLFELEEGKGLSGDSVRKIVENYPHLIAYLGDETRLREEINKLIQQEQDVQAKTIYNMLKDNEVFFNTKIKGNKELVDELKKMYSVDLNNFKSLAQAKEAIDSTLLKSLAKKWGDYFAIQADGLMTFDTTSMARDISASGRPDKISGAIIEAQKEVNKYNEMINKLNNIVVSGSGINLNHINLSNSALSSIDKASKDAQKKAEDAQKKAEEAREKMKQNVEDVEKAITEIIKKEYEKRKELIEKEYEDKKKALQKQKDLYNKQNEEDDYNKELKKEREILEGINTQIANTQRDSSLEGQAKLRELIKQQQEQQEKIDQMILERTRNLNNDMFDAELEKIEAEQKKKLDQLEIEFSETNISRMVNEALVTGQIKGIGDVLTAYQNFQNTYNNGLTASGQLIQKEFIDKWKEVQSLIKGTSGISIGVDIKALPVPKYDVGTPYIPKTQMALVHEGEAVLPKHLNIFTEKGLKNFLNIALNPAKLPAIRQNTGTSINFNQPLVAVTGGINSEIDLERVTNTATDKAIRKIKEALTDMGLVNP